MDERFLLGLFHKAVENVAVGSKVAFASDPQQVRSSTGQELVESKDNRPSGAKANLRVCGFPGSKKTPRPI